MQFAFSIFFFNDIYLITTKFIRSSPVIYDEQGNSTVVLRARTENFSGVVTIFLGNPDHPDDCGTEEHQGELANRKGFLVGGKQSYELVKGFGCLSASTNVQTR